MALSFIESWSKHCPAIYVAYADMPASFADNISAAYPSVILVPYGFRPDRNMNVRISQKMLFWEELAARIARDGFDNMCLADIDTVALRDFSALFSADVVFTRREAGARFFLNTGVVALSRRASSAGFVTAWREITDTILTDPSLLAQATDPRLPYGGGDQMAAITLLGGDVMNIRDDWQGLSIALAPCELYNLCSNDGELGQAHVVHLKASLHAFLLDRRPLVGERSAAQAREVLQTAYALNAQGRARLRQNGVHAWEADRMFSFRLPFTTQVPELSVNPIVVTTYRCIFWLRAWASRTRTALFSGGQRAALRSGV
jgi:hypothetical protein